MTKLKTGDRVLVITGRYKGKEAIIKQLLPNKNRVILDGLIQHKKHVKATKGKPEGGIKLIDGSIALSNLMYLSENAKPTRKFASKIGFQFDKKGEKTRVIKKTGKIIE